MLFSMGVCVIYFNIKSRVLLCTSWLFGVVFKLSHNRIEKEMLIVGASLLCWSQLSLLS